MATTYKNKRGYSSVKNYHILNTCLYVLFNDNSVYRYKRDDVGRTLFKKMVDCAKDGQFLGSYISSEHKPGFSSSFLIYNAGKKIKPEIAHRKYGFEI